MMDKLEKFCNPQSLGFNQESSLIWPSADIAFLQLCNHIQVAQHWQSYRSGLHFVTTPTQNLSRGFFIQLNPMNVL